jgi:hypothetical protein
MLKLPQKKVAEIIIDFKFDETGNFIDASETRLFNDKSIFETIRLTSSEMAYLWLLTNKTIDGDP